MAKTTEHLHQLGNKVYTSSTRWVSKGLYETNFFEAAKTLKVGVWIGSTTWDGQRPQFSDIDSSLCDRLYKKGILK